jgi:hypothetical protein
MYNSFSFDHYSGFRRDLRQGRPSSDDLANHWMKEFLCENKIYSQLSLF